MESFSVLMSIYYKEKAEYLRECFDSLLSQTLQANEWIIVEDGKLTNELYSILQEYEEKYPKLIKRIPLEKNVGLGLALSEGIKHCSYELIARMDTDDIAVSDRFEKQIKFMAENKDIDIVGSYIKEFENSTDNIVSIRRVPLTDTEIKKYQKRRSAFNHVTVVFRKNIVLKAGNYKNCLLMEDDMLWVDMFNAGAKGANLDECLVYVRVGKDMIQRRGGLSYIKNYYKGRKQIYKTGYISLWDFWYTIFIQIGVSIIPNKLRKIIFYKLLRK